MNDDLAQVWPPGALRLACGPVTLRPLREADLAEVARRQPEDYEHDPTVPRWPWMSPAQHRVRLLVRDFATSVGQWDPAAWRIGFVVECDGAPVGMQTLEADDFAELRTVDTGSWLIASARGRGLGVAMRAAVLGLAFDGLGAVAAISSARSDNAASLGVSRRLGYRDNGVSRTRSGAGPVELHHVRLSCDEWRVSPYAEQVRIDGLTACRSWFGAD